MSEKTCFSKVNEYIQIFNGTLSVYFTQCKPANTFIHFNRYATQLNKVINGSILFSIYREMIDKMENPYRRILLEVIGIRNGTPRCQFRSRFFEKSIFESGRNCGSYFRSVESGKNSDFPWSGINI